MKTRVIFGCMTGTSLDAIDVAAVEIGGTGLECVARFVAGSTQSLSDLQPRLRALADQAAVSAGEITAAANDFAGLHVSALRNLQERCGRPADLIAVHGQTVFHRPPLSWQLCNPAPIVAALQTPVVFDLRQADLASGGQGAPITPLADYILFRSADESRALVNLGGFCNFTLLPAAGPNPAENLARIRGGDICACNHLLNRIARTRLNAEYDREGAQAASGTADPAALQDLMDVLSRQSRGGRSLGTGDELGGWLLRHQSEISGASLARTACEAIAVVVARAVGEVDCIVLAGGGARNLALSAAIERASGRRTTTCAEFGVPVEFREAACMAVLGGLCQDRIPITLPQITHVPAPAPVAGAWMYPG